MRQRPSKSFSIALFLLCAGVAANADAQTLIFSEDFESGSSRWRAVTSEPVALMTDSACSTTFQREVIPFSGGRVFLTAPIAVTPGERYCMTVWIRGTGSSCTTQPFIGINGQWLVGHSGFGTPYIDGGTVVPVNSNGAWNWYTAPFTADSSSIEIMDEIFVAGGAGSADFDDIRIYRGACPSTPAGAPHDCPPPSQMCPCALNSDCNASAPVCDTATTRCGPCTRDSDCAGRSGANACDTATGACVTCSATNATACTGATPACNTATHSCVQCTATSAAACTGATPACNAATNACVQCTAANAAACAGATPVCGSANTCVLCTAGTGGAVGCAANPDGHACADDSMGRPFCGCMSDSDCGGASSGRLCDATTRRCVDGCSPAAGRNGCPADRFCSSNDATGASTGLCTTTCNFDSDCARTMPAAPRCLAATDAGASQCVACRTDADCAGRTDGRLVCATDTHACVACTATSTAACRAESAGSACLAGGTCGCAVDADCGGLASGRACDAMTRACTTGCRASGGNGCPAGTVCDAVGSALGSCGAAPDVSTSDGSADVSAPDASTSDGGADVSADASADVSADTSDDASVDAGADVTQDLATLDSSAPNDVASADAASTDSASADVASPNPNSASQTGGCGCSTPAQRAPNWFRLMMIVAAVAVFGRRSRAVCR